MKIWIWVTGNSRFVVQIVKMKAFQKKFIYYTVAVIIALSCIYLSLVAQIF